MSDHVIVHSCIEFTDIKVLASPQESICDGLDIGSGVRDICSIQLVIDVDTRI